LVTFFPGITLPSGTVTSRVDSVAGQPLNRLVLSGTGPASGTSALNLVGDMLRFGNFGSTTPLVTLAATNGNGLIYAVATPLSADEALAFDGNGTATFQFNGALTCPSGLVKRGTSTLILAGTNTLAYAEVQTGTLQVGRGSAAGDLGAGPVTNNALLRLHRGDSSTFANVLSGSGELRLGLASGGVIGAVTTLTGDNTFTGDIRIESGALRIPRTGVLGETSKQVLLGNGSSGKSRVIFAPEGGGMTIPASVSWKASNPDATYPGLLNESGDTRLEGSLTLTSGGGGTRAVVQAGHLTLAGPVAPDTSNRSLLLDGPADGTVSGPIRDQNAANTLSVEKYGSGTWTLSGSNTYSRGTSVNGGTLCVNGTLASLVSVSAGATLSGTGTLSTITLAGASNAPALLSPGVAGVGLISATGTVTFAAGSAYRWEISDWNGAPGQGFDHLSAGALAVTATATNPFTVFISPVSLTNVMTASRAFPILAASSALGALDPQAVRVDASAFTAAEGAWSLRVSDNMLELLYIAAAPEPPFKWTGETNSDWSVGANWTGGNVPGATNTPIFAAAVATNRHPTLSAPVTVAGLLFNNDSPGGVTLHVTKENRLTLASGGVVAVTAGVHTIDGPYVGTGASTTELSLSGSSTWRVEAGAVLTNSARLGGVSGKTVTKSGAGLLVIDSNNGGSGGYQTTWSVAAGALRFTQPGASGNSANAVTVSAGASIELANGVGLGSSGGATLSGAGVGEAGALRVVSGNTLLSGTGKIVLAADAAIGVDAGASLEVGKIVSESGGARLLNKVGGGTLRLATTNLFSGSTVVSAGTLAVGCNFALRAGSALSLSGGTFDASVFTNTLSTLTLADGTASAVAVNGGTCALSFTGLSGTGTLTVTGRLGLTTLRFGVNASALTSAQLVGINNDGHEVCLTPLGYLVRKQRGALLQIR
jgi:autotransporter-associated beta strand protein